MKEFLKNIFYNPVKIKPVWKWRFISIGIGFSFSFLVSQAFSNLNLIFAIMFVVSFVYFFFRAKRLKIRFNYCYFGMILIGCAIHLMLL